MVQTKAKPRNGFTYGDYLTWPEDERWELIDGEAFDMSLAHDPTHQRISRSLCLQIANFLEGKPCEMFNAPFDVLFPKNDEADKDVRSVVQPDILVICDSGKITTRGCRGAPDWIIEILSPYTAGKDQIKKRDLYERNGVKEFWIIHPTDRIVMTYLLAGKKYARAEIFDDESCIKVRTLPGLEIDFAKVFPHLPKVVRESPRKFQKKN